MNFVGSLVRTLHATEVNPGMVFNLGHQLQKLSVSFSREEIQEAIMGTILLQWDRPREAVLCGETQNRPQRARQKEHGQEVKDPAKSLKKGRQQGYGLPAMVTRSGYIFYDAEKPFSLAFGRCQGHAADDGSPLELRSDKKMKTTF